MSLPNYLAKIKSAGIYRFVWDKSQVPPQQAETMRLVVGYSDKGPFNTPVYVESISDFTSIYGNISKRLERKGVYFHRLAQQALQAGPILALNLKPFETEEVEYINFDASDVINFGDREDAVKKAQVSSVFNTNRFWTLDPDTMIEKLPVTSYMTIAATDTKDNSCSIFMRAVNNESYANITFRSWYASQGLEYPDYMESILDEYMSEYFAEIYVFRGEFTKPIQDGALKNYFEGGAIKNEYIDAFGKKADALAIMATDSNSNFVGAYTGITLPYFKDANGNYISLDLKFNADNTKHKMLMKLDESVLDEALGSEELKSALVVGYVAEHEEDVVDEKGEVVVDEKGNPVKEIVPEQVKADSAINPVYIKGYDYATIKKSDEGAKIWDACSKMISGGILEALTNRVDVDYHYIVDTFDPGNNSKIVLFNLAKAKDNAFAIVNFPKMSLFGNVDEVKKSFVMPSEVEGASWGAYYTQLLFSDGTVKSVIPSAALVSNLFMDKWGARQPYYIVAGPNFGRLSYSGLVGPDYNFGRSDLDVLEPMGINAIIYVPRKGTYINSNQTAKQVPVSGLSKVHIRELVIYLQNEIENLLQTYQWELNTQPLRDTIKAKADAICETIKNNGGVYKFVNICDETNNTPEVIDNEMIILDTEIEPARGAGKMVHQLTIHKTGGISSSIK